MNLDTRTGSKSHVFYHGYIISTNESGCGAVFLCVRVDLDFHETPKWHGESVRID